MQWFKIALLLALTGETSPENVRQREELMDQIGRAVVLPKEAKPLSSYGQNYAFVGNNQVMVVYFIPETPLMENSDCFHGDMKPCSKEEMRRSINENTIRRASYASAGKRRWFANERELPAINDGGCNQITIRYDLPTNQVFSINCNGRW
jgi:hypothetical protein